MSSVTEEIILLQREQVVKYDRQCILSISNKKNELKYTNCYQRVESNIRDYNLTTWRVMVWILGSHE